MSIHKHRNKRLQSEFNNLIASIIPLEQWIDLFGYESLDNSDRKFYAELRSKMQRLSHKINKGIKNG